MKGRVLAVGTVLLVAASAAPARAHFGMLIPSDNMVAQQEARTIRLTMSFSHPFQRMGMDMAKPRAFGVLAGGRKLDLLGALKRTRVMEHTAWMCDYRLRRPGAHLFFVEPVPYWEPGEDIYIVHYAKTVVAAFGDDEGWDAEIGLKAEIVPLSRPLGLYAGNVFQGIVKMAGQPVPYAEVEVEYYNRDGRAIAPTELMITQRLKADKNGVFTYAAPYPGWWGFAALLSSPVKLPRDGVKKEVEIGAVLWVRFEPWRSNPRDGRPKGRNE